MKTIIVLALAGLVSLTGWSQTVEKVPEIGPASGRAADKEPKTFYQLNFLVREVENERVVNSRAYSIVMSNDNDRGAIRAGEKVPFSSTSGAKTEWQQIDVGVNIDCYKLEEQHGQISIGVSAEISSVADTHGDTSNPVPIIRRNSWASTILLPLQKPTILYSSDDPTSKRTMQLQLTATLIR